jgi:hypothetical protein
MTYAPTATLPTDAPPAAHLYAALAAPFPTVYRRDIGGGTQAPYITGEQVTSRLNTVLGPTGWSFCVVSHGVLAEADEIWVQGELTVTTPDGTVTRGQFGSQKIKRARQTGNPLDIGFDLKGATTDALKKCASLVGVGLDLLQKQPPPAAPADPEGPTPEMWALVGRGFVEPEAARWAPFWSAVTEQLGLGWHLALVAMGDPADPVDYLRRTNTTIEALYRLLALHAESGRPLPQGPAGGHPPAGR